MFANVPQFQANGTIAPRRFCIPDTSADNMLLQASSQGTLAPYVSQVAQKGPPGLSGSDVAVAAVAGDNVEVRGPGDVAWVDAGAAVTRGNPVMTDTSGKAIAATTGNYYLGIALQSAAGANVAIPVHLMPHYHN